MTKFLHVVYVYPVEDGEPNMSKVKYEHEFWFKESAIKWMEGFNRVHAATTEDPEEFRAVYYGRVNVTTGELV